MPKGVPNKRYTPEFKRIVIEVMKEEKLSYLVRVHFSQTSTETMEDKIKRLLREEVRKM